MATTRKSSYPLAILMHRAALISSTLATTTFARTVKTAVGSWPSGSNVCFTHVLLPEAYGGAGMTRSG